MDNESFRIGQINLCGLVSKREVIHHHLLLRDVKVLLACETLADNNTSTYFNIPHYKVRAFSSREDHPLLYGQKGGGAMILAQEDVPTLPLDNSLFRNPLLGPIEASGV